MLSTIPLDKLLSILDDLPGLSEKAHRFKYSSSHIVGIGLAGKTPAELATKCWMYFPEANVPFYRVTVLSNYSCHNVPEPNRQWSLMCEVSESPEKSVDAFAVVDAVIDGLKFCKLIESEPPILSRWHRRLEYGYPTPFLGRDSLLEEIEPSLREKKIFTRGRFGGWKYEVSNQDHSCMQGVEAVNAMLLNHPEITYFHPELVNTRAKVPTK